MIQKLSSRDPAGSMAVGRVGLGALKKIMVVGGFALLLALLGIFVVSWGHRALFLEARAQRGDAEAQYWLGRTLFNTASTPADYQQAVEWLTKAAEANQTAAQLSLGLIYAKGTVVRRDQQKAIVWLQRAAATQARQADGVGQQLKCSSLARCFQLFPESADAWARDVACKNLELAAAARSTSLQGITSQTGAHYNSVRLRNVRSDSVMVELPQPNAGLATIKRDALTDRFARLCDYSNDKGVLPISVWMEGTPGTVIFATASPNHS